MVPSAPSFRRRSISSATPTSTSALNAWPRWNATSIRTRSSANAHQFRQHAVGRVGVDEGDLETEEALARLRVDQLGAADGELGQRASDVVDLVGDVVHSRAAIREELADRRVLAERREQLDAALADPHRDGLDALLGDRVAVLDAGAEEALVGGDGLVQILDGDAEMVDSARAHPRDPSYSDGSGTTRTVPTVSAAYDSVSTSCSSASSSSRSSVSFSSSACATRSSAPRCFSIRRTASWNASSVSRACSMSRTRFVSS